MGMNNNATLIVAVLALAVVSAAGINAAYAYSASLSAGDNTIGAEWLSIDYYKGDGGSISGDSDIEFSIDGEGEHVGNYFVYNPPASDLVLQVSSDAGQSVDILGAFSCWDNNPGYGAAIKSVKFMLEDNTTHATIECVLGGNHSGIAPTIITRTLAETGQGTGLFVYKFTIQEVRVYLIDSAYIQTDASGNVYVSVDGSQGTTVSLDDMKDFNKLDFLFHVETHQA